VLAFSVPGMPSGSFQTELSAWLQHVSSVALHWLSWLPGWVLLTALLGGLGLLACRVLRTATPRAGLPNHVARENKTELSSARDTAEGNPRDQDKR